MTCNNELHESLFESGEIVCLFCDFQLTYVKQKPQDCTAKYDLCCDCQEIINNNGMIVCENCGIVQGYETTREYVDFYENKHKMKRKSVYYRKYYIDNVLTDISVKYRITFSVEQKKNLDDIF